MWVATRAELNFRGPTGDESVRLSERYDEAGQLLFRPRKDHVLVSISIPLSTADDRVASFKYARRRMDSITFMSAGTAVRCDRGTSTIHEATLCFDGTGTPGLRAARTEALVVGREWDDAPAPRSARLPGGRARQQDHQRSAEVPAGLPGQARQRDLAPVLRSIPRRFSRGGGAKRRVLALAVPARGASVVSHLRPRREQPARAGRPSHQCAVAGHGRSRVHRRPPRAQLPARSARDLAGTSRTTRRHRHHRSRAITPVRRLLLGARHPRQEPLWVSRGRRRSARLRRSLLRRPARGRARGPDRGGPRGRSPAPSGWTWNPSRRGSRWTPPRKLVRFTESPVATCSSRATCRRDSKRVT